MAKAKAAQPLTAFGTNITPAPYVPLTGGFSIATLQDAQNAANQANLARYNQGLGVLTGGYNDALGSIEKAIGDSAKIGGVAQKRIDQNLKNDLGGTVQSAVSRGLGNTTVLNSMQDQDKRRANDATAQLNEQLAQARANLRLQEANLRSGTAGHIAQYIQSMNDQAPDSALYAQLAAQAASAPKHETVNLGMSPQAIQDMATFGMNNPPTLDPNAATNAKRDADYANGGGYYSKSSSGGGSGVISGGGGGGGGVISSAIGGGGGGSSSGGGSVVTGTGAVPSTPTAPSSGGGYAFFGNGGYVGPAGYKPPDIGGYGGSVSNYIPQNEPGSISISKVTAPKTRLVGGRGGMRAVEIGCKGLLC